MVLVLSVPLFYFVTHVRYLYTGRVDYDYNMKVNVFFGMRFFYKMIALDLIVFFNIYSPNL